MNDDTPIRAALAEWRAAFCSKDVDRLLALYAADAVLFDAIPPFSSGLAAMREKTLACFPYFPDGFALETHDLQLCVGSDMAAAHFLWHFTDLPPGHPAGTHWLRSSVLWRKQADGGWRIVHDHCSAPFDPYTEKVAIDPDAGAATAGTDGAAGCGSARNPVGWFEIYVHDMARARTFYETVFATQLTRLDSPPDIELLAFPMQPAGGGATGALARMEGCAAGDNSVLIYFSCADCAVEADRASQAGGRIHKPKTGIGPYGFIALVADTEGNLIGLHSMR